MPCLAMLPSIKNIQRALAVAIPSALLVVAMPGAWDAAAGAGAASLAALVSALFIAATERLASGRGGGWWPGLVLGLALAMHPGAALWVVPVFVAVVVARPAPATEARRGEGRLPTVPLTLMAAPLIALVVLVVLWPSLWQMAVGLF